MKKSTSKPHPFLLLAGLCPSAATLSSRDKEDVLPNVPGKPTTGSPSTTPPPVTPPSTPPPPTNQTPPPVTTSSQLKQFGTKVFRYDAQNRLVELSYTDQPTHGYTVVYEGDRPVQLNFKAGNNFMRYSYAGDKVVEAIRYYGENLMNYRYQFEYNGDKLVKVTSMSYTRSDDGRLGVEEYKYDAAGNLTEITVAWSTSSKVEDLGRPMTIRWGGYDDKPNPMPYADSGYYLPGVKLFENNPGFRDEEVYSYTYHPSGMPEQRSTKLTSHPHVPPLVSRFVY